MDFVPNINAVARELRRDALSPRNRLQSILYDAYYVESLVERGTLAWPLVANERCGLWYVPTSRQADTCYFKSTDGHAGQWQFSMRRLNIHLVALIAEHGGVCVVDSTRRGKKMPDALSKTIPMWCAVLNFIKFGPEGASADNWLRTAPVVPRSEHSQMSARVPQFAHEAQSLGVVTAEKLRQLDRPLQPCWVYPGAPAHLAHAEEGRYSVQCVTASRSVLGDKTISVSGNSWHYVQGAADDHELWASGLTPQSFWSQIDASLDVHGFIGDISDAALMQRLTETHISGGGIDVTWIDANIAMGKIASDVKFDALPSATVIVLSSQWQVQGCPTGSHVHHYKVDASKKGARQLRELLPQIVGAAMDKTVVLCDTGTDLAVAVALCLVCSALGVRVTKDVVRSQLARLSEMRRINPSRATLQSVHSFFMAREPNGCR
ncbi:Initiator tRNA phosphoribosyl transferase [[Candida] zeylanoides]